MINSDEVNMNKSIAANEGATDLRYRKAKVITILNQKGGVGKSVTTRNLGEALSAKGKKVLLIDCDPQGSLTLTCDIDVENIEVNIGHLIEEAITGKPFTSHEEVINKVGNVDVIAADMGLSSVEAALVGIRNRNEVSKCVIDEFKLNYDYVLIDCSPSLNVLNISVLAASDTVLIPGSLEFLPVKGLEMLIQTIIRVKRRINPKLKFEGILMTRYDKRMKLTKEIECMIYEAYQGDINIFNTRIPSSVKVSEATVHGKSIIEYAPRNPVAKAYKALAEEVVVNE